MNSSAAAWSPDAKQLAFVAGSSTASGASGDDAKSSLWVVAAEGGRAHLLVTTGVSGRPSWGAFEPGAGSHD